MNGFLKHFIQYPLFDVIDKKSKAPWGISDHQKTNYSNFCLLRVIWQWNCLYVTFLSNAHNSNIKNTWFKRRKIHTFFS